jgi:hypothetical protein
MVYEEYTGPIHQQKPVKIDDDGGISIVQSYESSISFSLTHLYFNKIPLWANLLSGRYNLTCQMRLRRQVGELFSCLNLIILTKKTLQNNLFF